MKNCRTILMLSAVLWGCPVLAAVPVASPLINSLSVSATNLEFWTTFPPGVDHAVLEMRPTLMDSWQAVAQLDVPADGGMVAFTIPMPASETAFFRLNATLAAVTDPALSAELEFVAVPPLGPDAANPNEAIFHFRGQIDGSDRIVVDRHGALWNHVNWGWPDGAVSVNGSRWNPAEKNYLTSTGAVTFLPADYSLAAADLEIIEGRDVIALERTNEALTVYLDDTPGGAAPYEFKIHFHRLAATPVVAANSTAATLRIAAQIDGSDRLKITGSEATWTHLGWALPQAITLNDIPWDLAQTNVLANAGTNRFLPDGIDLATARITRRQGRDVATLRAEPEAVWVTFADNPGGGDAYELEISFGP